MPEQIRYARIIWDALQVLRDAADRQKTENLHSLGIERLDAEEVLIGKRPNIPLSQLTPGRLERLLAVVDRWIDDVSAYSGS